MEQTNAILQSVFGAQVDAPPLHLRGILQTTDYLHFMLLSDTGTILHEWVGAKEANRCLPGDHVGFVEGKFVLELRDEHPPIVGTLELTGKSTYGMTRRGRMMYLCTPYDKKYPPFIVGSSAKDRTRNQIVLLSFESWDNTFPRGSIQRTLGYSGDESAEKEALIWQACPWNYPEYDYQPSLHSDALRTPLTGYTFHIDPEGCRDVDDVFTFEKVEDGWKVTITISDVASYVEDGGAVDIMASLIGQTLYGEEGQVLRPMLPPSYSEDTCSLLPGKASYGISMSFVWNGSTCSSPHWFLSTLRVDRSYTYEEFQACDSPYPLKDIASSLAKEPLEDSHQWVEQMMILYNTEAGSLLRKAGQGILRRHSAPNQTRLESFRAHCPEWSMLAFSSAEYCLADETESHHYGLDSGTYAHASSPIRRYADIINQRVLTRIINGSTERFIVPQAMYDMNHRSKAIKKYARDMCFLRAIVSGQNEWEGIIMEKKTNEYGVKLTLYVPLWKRMISTMYRALSENVALSRDETHEIDVTLYRTVQVRCAFSPNERNWKERAVIHIT